MVATLDQIFLTTKITEVKYDPQRKNTVEDPKKWMIFGKIS